MKVAVLSGGGGGASFLRGVVASADPAEVTAIVNVGDDLEVLGLSVSPDLGGEAWFRLGDRDLGLHVVRTQSLRAGDSLSAVTARLAAALGVETTILPATDEPLRTWLETPNGSFDFQQWFVARAHRDPVDRVRYEGASDARPAPGVLDALHEAELI